MAATRVTYHVTPFGSGWQVAAEGRDVDVVRDNKEAALAEAKRLAKDEPLGQVIVHGEDGRIQEEFTYGSDIPG